MEEGALLLADVHERGLDAGEDRLDPSEIDVADDAAVIGTVDQQLDQPVVLEDGHAGLPLAPVDQDLALHASNLDRAPRDVRPGLRPPLGQRHAGPPGRGRPPGQRPRRADGHAHRAGHRRRSDETRQLPKPNGRNDRRPATRADHHRPSMRHDAGRPSS